MSDLLYFFRAGGWAMWPLLLLSIASGAIIVERFLAFGAQKPQPQVLADVLQAARNGDWEVALQTSRAQNDVVSQCLATAIEHRTETPERIAAQVEEVGQERWMSLERGLWLLDTSTTIAPLLGLLGTILGMVAAFNSISAGAQSGDRARSADAVLGGVGEALYATATGIVIAVICFVAYNAFANRLRHLTAQTELWVTKLMNTMNHRVHGEHRDF